jgi:hypothetical protein
MKKGLRLHLRLRLNHFMLEITKALVVQEVAIRILNIAIIAITEEGIFTSPIVNVNIIMNHHQIIIVIVEVAAAALYLVPPVKVPVTGILRLVPYLIPIIPMNTLKELDQQALILVDTSVIREVTLAVLE